MLVSLAPQLLRHNYLLKEKQFEVHFSVLILSALLNTVGYFALLVGHIPVRADNG